MTKMKELIQDFKLNQEVLGRVKRYVDVCMFRLNRWERLMERELGIVELEDVNQVKRMDSFF
jgi:integrase/recombinase XerD